MNETKFFEEMFDDNSNNKNANKNLTVLNERTNLKIDKQKILTQFNNSFFKDYQENIRKSGRIRPNILNALKTKDKTLKQILKMCVEYIYATSGDIAFYNAANDYIDKF